VGWKHLQALWERVAQQEYDRIATGLPYEEYLAQVGAYQACVRHLTLVDTIIEKADQINERKRIDAERQPDRSIFFANPYR
jgi:hypothetical protein